MSISHDALGRVTVEVLGQGGGYDGYGYPPTPPLLDQRNKSPLAPPFVMLRWSGGKVLGRGYPPAWR